MLIASSTTADVKLERIKVGGELKTLEYATDSMVRRILFAFCRGIEASIELNGSGLTWLAGRR